MTSRVNISAAPSWVSVRTYRPNRVSYASQKSVASKASHFRGSGKLTIRLVIMSYDATRRRPSLGL